MLKRVNFTIGKLYINENGNLWFYNGIGFKNYQ